MAKGKGEVVQRRGANMWLWLSLVVVVAGLYWSHLFSFNSLIASTASTSSTSIHVVTAASATRYHGSRTTNSLKHSRPVSSQNAAKYSPTTSASKSSQDDSSISAQKSDSTSPTHPRPTDDIFTAAAAGRWQDVANFLETGSDPRDQDSRLFTPLHHAAVSGDIKTIDLLLQYGKTGWFADNHVTPLHLAARYGHTAAVERILKTFPQFENARAVAPHAIEKLKTSMQHRFDIKLATFFRQKTLTARELAAIYGHGQTVLAFSRGPTSGLVNALSCACLMGDVKMVRELWNYNKAQWWYNRIDNPEAQVAGFPAPPLHLAVMSGNRQTVAFLLEEGLSTKATFRWATATFPAYSPAAHYAAVVGSVELLKALERIDADLTGLDYLSRTPLSYAVESLNIDAVEFLIEKEHPGRGIGLVGSRDTRRWLGPGHVWPSKQTMTTAGSKQRRMRSALGRIGLKAP